MDRRWRCRCDVPWLLLAFILLPQDLHVAVATLPPPPAGWRSKWFHTEDQVVDPDELPVDDDGRLDAAAAAAAK